MSDGIVIIGSGFAARQLVKNIRKQDAEIPLTLIAADSMDEYNKPDLSHVISRGQHADDLTLQSAGEFAEQYNLRLFPHTWVNDIDAENHRVKSLDKQWRYDKLVLATGADPRTLGVAGETELLGRGVAYCAACDGMFYKGKTVVVVGGGNSAAADALLLSRVAKKVILVHRRDTLRATKIYHEPLAQAENVEFRWNSVVSALLSGDRLTGVRLRDTVTGEESVVDCDGVFVSVGRQPATALAVGQLALDGGGYIVAGETTETSIPGVYAVGDVRTKPLRQVVTAVADGAVAVHMAEKYIAENR
jgi:thioredoxin reductase (NADPH)